MNYLEKLKDIKAFIFDVDGVLTDGMVYLMPGGNMCRAMNVLDGLAFVKAFEKNYKIGVITGGDDPMVRHRLEYLGVKDYYPKSPNKLVDYEDFKSRYNLKDEEIMMMGDDIPDIRVLKKVHISTCPANAVPEVKEVAEYISPVYGGKGAARDVISMVMKAQGTWTWHDDDKMRSA